tara:strand:+ start:5065 stop:6822 length:1758 start_codon:yes stop_codon:yes gene_type:complete
MPQLQLPLELVEQPPVSMSSTESDDDVVIEECYITDVDGTPDIVSGESVKKSIVNAVSMQGFESSEIEEEAHNLMDVRKFVGGSTQIVEVGAHEEKVVPPPYAPELMLKFLQLNEVVHQCVRVKATDYVGRGYRLMPVMEELLTKEYDAEDAKNSIPDTYPEDHKEVTHFLGHANEVIGTESALFKAAQDYEGVGWAALEVVRSMDMKVVKLDHIPADRLKVIRGWRGFVETGPDGSKCYYQPFGTKVVSSTRTNAVTNKPEPYDPEEDGELTSNNAKWRMLNYKTGEPTNDFRESANEVIWIPRHHPTTIYYGMSDNIPATSDILANAKIREYLLQFFDHNTVPRYVVVIKGAKLSPEVKKTILDYFSTHVRGRAHKTLVLPIPSGRGSIEVKFEKLDSDPADGWFRRTAQDNNENIRISHGVPTSVATFADASGMGSGKGLAQAEIYKDRVVSPGQKLWADLLNRVFRLGLGITTVELKFDELDTRDKEAAMRINTQLMDRGVLSINDVRRDMGLAPIQGGDRPYIKTNRGIMFVDEIETLTSFEQDDQRGGDRTIEEPSELGAGNSAQDVIERFSQNTSEMA